MLDVRDVHVIDEPDTAAVILDPLRARLLAELTVPGSATTVAAALDLPRQKVNYHLRALENVGLVRQVTSRQRRGLTERVLESSARSYVVSPAVLGPSTLNPHAPIGSPRHTSLRWPRGCSARWASSRTGPNGRPSRCRH